MVTIRINFTTDVPWSHLSPISDMDGSDKKHKHHKRHKHKKHKKHRNSKPESCKDAQANDVDEGSTEQEIELDQIEYNMDVIEDGVTLSEDHFLMDAEHCEVSSLLIFAIFKHMWQSNVCVHTGGSRSHWRTGWDWWKR